jgi:RNA-directed DNA polymerase
MNDKQNIAMIDYFETKSQPITRAMVVKAYKKVRANQGSGGVDEMDWEYLVSARQL